MNVRELIAALEAFASEMGDDTEVLGNPPHQGWAPIEYVVTAITPDRTDPFVGIALDYPL